jgi:hypothetical protein
MSSEGQFHCNAFTVCEHSLHDSVFNAVKCHLIIFYFVYYKSIFKILKHIRESFISCLYECVVYFLFADLNVTYSRIEKHP